MTDVDTALSLISESEDITGYDDVFPHEHICENAGYTYAFCIGDSENMPSMGCYRNYRAVP